MTLDGPHGIELSAATREAAARHGIDLTALVIAIRERLFSELEDGQVVILSEDDARRTFLVAVAVAANLVVERLSIHIAWEAVEAARATGNEAMIDAAFAHLDTELSDALRREGLMTLVDDLDYLFTDHEVMEEVRGRVERGGEP